MDLPGEGGSAFVESIISVWSKGFFVALFSAGSLSRGLAIPLGSGSDLADDGGPPLVVLARLEDLIEVSPFVLVIEASSGKSGTSSGPPV